MKKFILFILVALCIPSPILIAKLKENSILAIGTFQFPVRVKESPISKVFFEGFKYPVHLLVDVQGTASQAYYEIYVDTSKSKELHILIAENIKLPDQNNVQHLKTSSNDAYTLYKLTQYELPATTQEEVVRTSWYITKVEKSGQSIDIPDNTIIIFAPPSAVESIEEDPWQTDEGSIRLPKIIFMPKMTLEELRALTVKMMMTIIDFEAFHASVPKRMMVGNSRVVAMPMPTMQTGVLA